MMSVFVILIVILAMNVLRRERRYILLGMLLADMLLKKFIIPIFVCIPLIFLLVFDFSIKNTVSSISSIPKKNMKSRLQKSLNICRRLANEESFSIPHFPPFDTMKR